LADVVRTRAFVQAAEGARAYFQSVVEEWGKEEFARGIDLATLWADAIARDADAREALALALEVNEHWIVHHRGASGWARFRCDVLDWLLYRVEDAAWRQVDFEVVAAAYRKHFALATEGGLGAEGQALATEWLTLIASKDRAKVKAFAAKVAGSAVAQVMIGHGLASFVDAWVVRGSDPLP